MPGADGIPPVSGPLRSVPQFRRPTSRRARASPFPLTKQKPKTMPVSSTRGAIMSAGSAAVRRRVGTTQTANISRRTKLLTGQRRATSRILAVACVRRRLSNTRYLRNQDGPDLLRILRRNEKFRDRP
jgi:hypothetical protein